MHNYEVKTAEKQKYRFLKKEEKEIILLHLFSNHSHFLILHT